MSKTCIVIPCYNEALRLNVSDYASFLQQNREQYDLMFVNDGSTDDTEKLLLSLAHDYPGNCFVHSLTVNSGKAEAIRQGVQKAFNSKLYSYIAYFDADLATPLNEVKYMRAVFEDNKDMVMVLCSRMKRLGARVERKLSRHYLGRIFATFASIILKLPVYDTQCGAKLIKAEAVPLVFNEPFITRWLFDVELLARLRNKYEKTILNMLYEHPVTEWRDVGGSKLKLKHMIRVPFDLLKIRNKYN